jgi:thiaminase
MISSSASAYSAKLQRARKELDNLQQEQQELKARLQQAQGGVDTALKGIRSEIITAIRKGEQFEWTDVDEKVSALFQQLDARNSALLQQLQQDEAATHVANAGIKTALAKHEEASAVLEQLDGRIDAATDAITLVQDTKIRINDITLLTDRLSEQFEAAEAEANNKRKAYEADRYFRYLWRRGYGNERYRSGTLAARFDRWLAERCHYNENARHYEVLLALPPRLKTTLDESAAQLKELQLVVDLERSKVAVAMERGATQKIVDGAAEGVTQARAVLSGIKQRMDKTRQETLQIQASEHPLHNDITALVTKAMANNELARFVSDTVGTRDNALLKTYESDHLQQCQLQAQIAANSAAQQMQQSEIDELENAYQRAKRKEDAALLAAAVILNGQHRHHHHGHGGGFGGGGFGGGRGGGGFGGGGFGRGGGFGGGGFSRGARF